MGQKTIIELENIKEGEVLIVGSDKITSKNIRILLQSELKQISELSQEIESLKQTISNLAKIVKEKS
jgi:hypothetical protein